MGLLVTKYGLLKLALNCIQILCSVSSQARRVARVSLECERVSGCDGLGWMINEPVVRECRAPWHERTQTPAPQPRCQITMTQSYLYAWTPKG